METITKTEAREEAVKRMKLLNIFPQTINEFEDEGTVNYSDYGCGILYWLDDSMKKMVSKFEDDHNAVVYHVIHDRTAFGELLSLLFVGVDEQEYWEEEREELQDRSEDGNIYTRAYVYNLSEPMFSEYGYIGITPKNGGLRRTS